MSFEELAAEVDAAFAIELARSRALQALVERYGVESTRLVWRMGWCCGKEAGLAAASRIMSE